MRDLLNNLPAGITEDDLVDLIDGAALDPAREKAVLGALRREPRLGLLIKQMRDDRAGLDVLGDVHAPLGLAEGIEQRIEREALRTLAMAESAVAEGDPIPISTVRVETPGVWTLLMESAWPRRLATAASIAIVGGLAVFGGREAWRALQPTLKPKNIAVNPPEAPVVPDGDGATAPAPIEVAANTNTGADARPDAGASDAIVAAARTELTIAEAAMLAGEDRLAISVLAPRDGAAQARRIDALARSFAHSRESTWNALPMAGVPVEYAMLAVPTLAAPVRGPVGANGPNDRPDIAVASDHASGRGTNRPKNDAPISPPTEFRPVVKAMYTVEIEAREQAITDLVASLKDANAGENGPTVVLRKLEAPLVRPISLRPEDILWWSGPASAWSKRATIPVVIETLE